MPKPDNRHPGFNARVDLVYKYYSNYANNFHSVCGLVGTDRKMYGEDYWNLWYPDIFRYLVNIAKSENHWADTLSRLAKYQRESPDFHEEERFLYWFIIHT